MRIGMIGTGSIGSTLIRAFRQLGHHVQMANSRGIDSMSTLANETGAIPMNVNDVVKNVDLVVVTIPMKAIPQLPNNLFVNCPNSLIVIDTCNYYPLRDGIINDIENGTVEGIWVSKYIQRPVIKAFNNINVESLAKNGLPNGSSNRIALPISGDNTDHKTIVSNSINDIGFDVYDAGELEDSWRQQPGSPVYCTDFTINELPNALNRARKQVLPKRRDEEVQRLMVISNGNFANLTAKAVAESCREVTAND